MIFVELDNLRYLNRHFKEDGYKIELKQGARLSENPKSFEVKIQKVYTSYVYQFELGKLRIIQWIQVSQLRIIISPE